MTAHDSFMENIMDINIKRAGTAYNFYIVDMCNKHKLKMVEASKKYGPHWKSMSEKDKEKYNKLSQEDEARFKSHMQ